MRIALLALAILSTLALGAMPGFARDRLDRSITFYNDSGVTINRIYATNVGNDDWGPSRLRGSLRSGRNVTLDLNDRSGYCIYDLRAEGRGGFVWEQYKFNVCSEYSVYIN